MVSLQYVLWYVVLGVLCFEKSSHMLYKETFSVDLPSWFLTFLKLENIISDIN